MKCLILFVFIFNLNVLYQKCVNAEITEKDPTIVIVTLIRNKAYTLPYFFSYLQNLNYPKSRITLWMRTDHNEDNSNEIIHTWLATSARDYHHVDFEVIGNETRRENESTPTHWPEERHLDIIKYKEEAMRYAKQIWADFVFYLDADVLLTDSYALKYLVKQNHPVIAPMVLSDGLYSNFWCGMSDQFYYQRTAEYKQIYTYNKTGEFPVPMIHSAVLINLRDIRTDNLTFNRTVFHQNLIAQGKDPLQDVPIDDIIIFSLSAKHSNTQLYVSNTRLFGFIMVPLDEADPLERDLEQLTNINIHIINDVAVGLILNKNLSKFVKYPEKDTMGLSKIYMINLERREKRRLKMEQCFQEIGLDVNNYLAIDGKLISDEQLNELGIEFLSGYADPYHNRPMTLGEIGCFLSHYNIWREMVEFEIPEILVLEDDIRFEPYFKDRAQGIIKEARSIGGWDLIYLGRKRLENQDEPYVQDSQQLVEAGYSYWTLGYVLTLQGAKKLLDAKPLKRLLPVDEFLPIMFDKHTNTSWKLAFETRNLIAWSAAPLILYPTHYTGEEGYVSDTEDSLLITGADIKKEKKGNKEQFMSGESLPFKMDENEIKATFDLKSSLNEPNVEL